jgi:hypothetical protein
VTDDRAGPLLAGLTLVTIDNEPVGEIEAIYVDRSSRQPEWALVQTGLFVVGRLAGCCGIYCWYGATH